MTMIPMPKRGEAMRWKIAAIGITFIILSSIALIDRSLAQDTVSIDLFYQELSPYGEWSPHVEFGDVWQPYEVGPEWKPYTDGRWEWSDQGWIWISYEPWGWATYHYGRWIFDDYQGWIWIPGTTWAPAWVSWHQSPEYIGWSPLPPDRGFFVEIGFVFNSYNSYYYKPYRHKHHHKKHRYKKNRYYHNYYHNPHNYRPPARHSVFLPHHRFGHHKHAGKAAAPPPHYDIVLRNSKNVTNIKRINNKVINYGPDKHFIEKRSKRKLVRHNIVDRNNVTLRGKTNANNIKGDRYNVYRPKIERGNRNPYITNRNQIKNSSLRNNNGNSLPHKQTQLKNPSQNINSKSKHKNQTRIPEPSKRTGLSKNNDFQGNSGIKKAYKQNQRKNISKNKYNTNSDRYNKNNYKAQQQRNSRQVQKPPNVRTQNIQGKKVSSQRLNHDNKSNQKYKITNRSNNYGKSQYGQNNRSYNKPNQKTPKKSGNKNYSNKSKQASNKKSNVSKRSSYKQKIRTIPSSRKPTLSKR